MKQAWEPGRVLRIGGAVAGAALMLWAGAARAQELQAAAGKKSTSVALGVNLTSGNSETMMETASLTHEQEWGKNILRAGMEAAYGETKVENSDGSEDTETTAANAKGKANYKRTLDRAYSLADLSVVHDDVADVAYRVIAGPGVGYFLRRTETDKLSAELGAGYLWEEVDGVYDDYPVFRFSERYEIAMTQSSKAWEQAEYVPKAEDFSDYMVSAEAGVEASATKTMSLRLVVKDTYDSTPGADKEYNDVSVIGALAWKLQ